MTGHWIERVRERIGGNVDPRMLWDSIKGAIETDRTDLVQYLGRTDRAGTRRFLFRTPDGRRWIAVVCTRRWLGITVYSADEAPCNAA